MSTSFNPMKQSEFVVGRGAIAALARLGGRRIGIFHGGKSMPESLMARLQALLAASGAECRFLMKITNEPYFDDVERASRALEDYRPDLVVAIGGGAVMDTAKAAILFYENPGMSVEAAVQPYRLPPLGKKVAFAAVPTTSGTGSETTSAAVFTDRATKRKHLMLDNGLIPRYAILDADLVDSLPSSIVALTGMDALTHALEASVSVAASAMVRAMAISAAVDLIENLAPACRGLVDDAGRMRAREACLVAASLAGVAITNSCAGLAHGFDQPGPYFGVPHGQVCGMLLPYTTAFSGIQPSYVTVAKRLGLPGDNERDLCQSLVDFLLGFSISLGMPRGFSACGIARDEYSERIPAFTALALGAVATGLSPRVPSAEEARSLFGEAYDGTRPVVHA